jgi:hypothetical protein
MRSVNILKAPAVPPALCDPRTSAVAVLGQWRRRKDYARSAARTSTSGEAPAGLVNVALADSVLLRREIRLPSADLSDRDEHRCNPETTADWWSSYIVASVSSTPHHSTFSRAAAAVLARFFGTGDSVRD